MVLGSSDGRTRAEDDTGTAWFLLRAFCVLVALFSWLLLVGFVLSHEPATFDPAAIEQTPHELVYDTRGVHAEVPCPSVFDWAKGERGPIDDCGEVVQGSFVAAGITLAIAVLATLGVVASHRMRRRALVRSAVVAPHYEYEQENMPFGFWAMPGLGVIWGVYAVGAVSVGWPVVLWIGPACLMVAMFAGVLYRGIGPHVPYCLRLEGEWLVVETPLDRPSVVPIVAVRSVEVRRLALRRKLAVLVLDGGHEITTTLAFAKDRRRFLDFAAALQVRLPHLSVGSSAPAPAP
jgi:hypothetical protein